MKAEGNQAEEERGKYQRRPDECEAAQGGTALVRVEFEPGIGCRGSCKGDGERCGDKQVAGAKNAYQG